MSRVSVYKGTAHRMATLPEVTGELQKAAKKIQTAARALAAAEAGKRPSDKWGPDYHTTFRTAPIPGPGGIRDYEVATDHPYGSFIELGHHHPDSGTWVPGKHTLLRATEAVSSVGR